VADELAGSLHLSRSAQAGEGCRLFNAVDNSLGDIKRSGRIVFLDAFNSGYKLVGRLSTEPASRVKQLVDTVKRLFVLYKLATVGLLNASLHSCDEAGLVFKHAINGLFHQLLSILAIGSGHLLKPSFNIRREMYFHTSKRRDGNGKCQSRLRCLRATAAAAFRAVGTSYLRC
jgi:hypothetical protein